MWHETQPNELSSSLRDRKADVDKAFLHLFLCQCIDKIINWCIWINTKLTAIWLLLFSRLADDQTFSYITPFFLFSFTRDLKEVENLYLNKSHVAVFYIGSFPWLIIYHPVFFCWKKKTHKFWWFWYITNSISGIMTIQTFAV